MTSNPFSLSRTIILEKGAEQSIDAALNVERFDDTYRALEWLLARNPAVGRRLSATNPGFHVYRMDSIHWAGTPTIDVVYTYNEDQVTIYGIRIVPYTLDPS